MSIDIWQTLSVIDDLTPIKKSIKPYKIRPAMLKCNYCKILKSCNSFEKKRRVCRDCRREIKRLDYLRSKLAAM